MTTEFSQLGLAGLAVMGANLARNIAAKGLSVSVYNRSYAKTELFLRNYGNEKLRGFGDLKAFVSSLIRPRIIILMIQSGEPVDELIGQLKPFLERGDILVDCGNSDYRDTIRRTAELSGLGLHFFGCGVSGGEEGALHGPSLMPGGEKSVYERLAPVFAAIAAKDFHGNACVTYTGADGAGHFVKMVHNGIEYAIMQMMAEAWLLLSRLYQLKAPEIAEIFAKYQQGKLESFLFETAVEVLRKPDDFGSGFLIDYILDTAGQKGTGRQTALEALQHGVDVSAICGAVFARISSANREQRKNMSSLYGRPAVDLPPLSILIDELEKALYAGMLLAYEEGFGLMSKMSVAQEWDLNFAEIARIWQGGCIIRSRILQVLEDGFKGGNCPLKEIKEIASELRESIPYLRHVVTLFIGGGLPVYSMSGALTAFDSSTSALSSAAFIQGLRDCFGAHTYQRLDREGIFHSQWE
jgi:6-phosphogluconate dehydrogenase